MTHDPSAAPLLTSDDRIDDICDAFEDKWLAGERPSIEAYICRSSSTEQPSLFYELLLVEIEYRQKIGERPLKIEYLAQYSAFAELIEAIDFKHGFDNAFNATDAQSDDIGAGNVLGIPDEKQVRHVAQFELLELLGAGAAGDVWKARDSRLQRIVAIKLPRSRNLSEIELHRFLREARAAAQLRHPNLVPVHEVGRDSRTVFIVSDFIPGESLRMRLSQQRYVHREAVELCAKLAEALHHAHEQGIVHRDLKPANVIIDLSGEPHLTDFGLAKLTSDVRDLTLPGQLLGTLAYMAPEQARGATEKVDARTDVYALGALLYEMLTGRCPFQGDEVMVIHAIVHDEPIHPRSIARAIPRALETICLKAINKEPRRRYATAQELAVDLRRFLRGEPILARRASYFERSWRWLRRHPAAAVSILLAVCVAAATMAITSLKNENFALQDYRKVDINSTPSGARIALVPIDVRTGEPSTDMSSVILPQELTPIRIDLKPGKYFIEAALPNENEPRDFAEIYRTVAPSDMLSKQQLQVNRERREDEDQMRINVSIRPARDILKGMIAAPTTEKGRQRNPLLPKVLFIDARETVAADSQRDNPISHSSETAESEKNNLSLADAERLAELSGKRLPSAAEYDAILDFSREAHSSDAPNLGTAAPDLFNDRAEWTTTKYEFGGIGSSAAVTALHEMQVLKGYGDAGELSGLLRLPDGTLLAPPESGSRAIGFRGVHSAAPRFLKW